MYIKLYLRFSKYLTISFLISCVVAMASRVDVVNNENFPFYRDRVVSNTRLRLYGRIWRAMRLFIDETMQQNNYLNLETTRFKVRCYEYY